MFKYERCIDGKYLKIESNDKEEFLTKTLVDVTNYAYEFLPWDVKKVYNSLPDDWDKFFKKAKTINRALKKHGLSTDEVKFARSIILMKKVIDLLKLDTDEDSVSDCENDFVYFVFIGDDKRKAVKRFTFTDKMENIDKFRAFTSIQSSIVTKMCGKLKKVKKDKNAIDSFDPNDATLCDVIVTLKKLGVDPVIDIKKLDKYLNSL